MTRIGLKWHVDDQRGTQEPTELSAFFAAVSEMSQRLPWSDRPIVNIDMARVSCTMKATQDQRPLYSKMFTKRFEVKIRYAEKTYPHEVFHLVVAKVAFYYAPGSCSNTLIESFKIDDKDFKPRDGSVVAAL